MHSAYCIYLNLQRHPRVEQLKSGPLIARADVHDCGLMLSDTS